MVEGRAGAFPVPFTVTAMVRAVPIEPQALIGVTLIVPPFALEVTVTLLVLPPAVCTQPAGNVQA
jgi:hypothetical protein